MKPRLNRGASGFGGTDDSQMFLKTEVHADILSGCNANCNGCFIPRKNGSFNLEILYNKLLESAFYPDEITIGPTDIFDAINFEEVLEDRYLQKLYDISGISFTSALKQDYNLIKEKHKRLWDVAEYPDIDFKIVVDINSYLLNGLDDKKLGLFKEGSVQFRVNYHKGMFDKISYNDLAYQIHDRYNSPIVVVPNFFVNNNNTGKVSEMLVNFRKDLEGQEIAPEFLEWYTMFDSKFNSYGCTNYSFYNNKFFISPFIFDGVLQRDNLFEVDDLNSCNVASNIVLAGDTECGDCQWIISCSERNVPLYMKSRGIETCIIPKRYMYANNQK
jgi:hypothetical protein